LCKRGRLAGNRGETRSWCGGWAASRGSHWDSRRRGRPTRDGSGNRRARRGGWVLRACGGRMSHPRRRGEDAVRSRERTRACRGGDVPEEPGMVLSAVARTARGSLLEPCTGVGSHASPLADEHGVSLAICDNGSSKTISVLHGAF
jgi:hypothetical protein